MVVESEKALFAIDLTDDEMKTFSIGHSEKAPIFISSRYKGSVTFLSDLQLLKAYLSIILTELGNVISSKEMQLKKVEGSIFVILCGIDIFLSAEQLANAAFKIDTKLE